MWPFRRRKQSNQGTLELDENGTPTRIPIYNTPYEAIISGILERAQSASYNLDEGQYEFEISMTDGELSACEYRMELISPLFVRANEYNLMLMGVVNEKLLFSPLRP